MNFLPISDGKYVIIAEHWTSMQKEDNANTKKKEKGQRKAAHTEPKQMALKQIPIPKFYARRIRRIVLRNGYGRVAVFLSLMSSAMIQTTTAMTPWTKSVEMLRLVLYFVNIFASLTLCQVYNSAEDFFDAIRNDFKNGEPKSPSRENRQYDGKPLLCTSPHSRIRTAKPRWNQEMGCSADVRLLYDS